MMPVAAPGLASLAFAAVVGFAAVVAALAASAAAEPARSYLRFAAALAGALAVADATAAMADGLDVFAAAIMLLAAALVPAALVLAAAAQDGRPLHRLPATLVLAAACLAGLVAAATGSALLGFAPLVAAAVVLGWRAIRSWRGGAKFSALLGLGAGALTAAAASYMSGGDAGRTGFGLFFAAGLLGVTLAIVRGSDPAVERTAQRRAGRTLFIRRKD